MPARYALGGAGFAPTELLADLVHFVALARRPGLSGSPTGLCPDPPGRSLDRFATSTAQCAADCATPLRRLPGRLSLRSGLRPVPDAAAPAARPYRAWQGFAPLGLSAAWTQASWLAASTPSAPQQHERAVLFMASLRAYTIL